VVTSVNVTLAKTLLSEPPVRVSVMFATPPASFALKEAAEKESAPGVSAGTRARADERKAEGEEAAAINDAAASAQQSLKRFLMGQSFWVELPGAASQVTRALRA
jgi:hypothetical protein